MTGHPRIPNRDKLQSAPPEENMTRALLRKGFAGPLRVPWLDLPGTVRSILNYTLAEAESVTSISKISPYVCSCRNLQVKMQYVRDCHRKPGNPLRFQASAPFLLLPSVSDMPTAPLCPRVPEPAQPSASSRTNCPKASPRESFLLPRR